MKCRRGKREWEGSEPLCAFSRSGEFISNNWNCKLLNGIAYLCTSQWNDEPVSNYVYSNDCFTGVLPIGDTGDFAIFCRYKNHGRVDRFWIASTAGIREGTENDALLIARLYKKELRRI